MVQLLKINNPGLVFFSVFLSVSIHLLAAFFPADFRFLSSYTEPLSHLIFPSIVNMGSMGFYLLLLIGCIVQILQAFLVDSILNNYKIIGKRSYIGGMVFVLASSLDKSWLFFSPMQISLLLILLLINDIFALSKQERFYKEFFNIGFSVSLSVLFYFPSLFLLLFIFPALFSVRPFHIKDVLRVLVGIVTPIFMVASIYFLTDQSEILSTAMANQFKIPLLSLSFFTKQHAVSLILIATWLMLSGLFVVAIPFSITMQTRKMIGVLIIETVLCTLFFFFPTHFSIAYLLLISPLIAIFLAILLSEMKNDLIANVIFGLLIVSTFSVIIFN